MRIFGLFFLLAGVLFACSGARNEPDTGPLVRAREAVDAKQYTQALFLLNDIHDAGLKTPEYYTIKGLSYLKLGDLRRALSAYKKVKPQPLSVKLDIAYLYLLLGEVEKAEKLTQKMVSKFGPTPEIILLKGNIYLKKELFKEAEASFGRAIRQNKNFAKAYIGLANVFLKQRAFERAERYYLEAVALPRESSDADIALANFYLSTGRGHDAQAHIERTLEAYPNDINLSMALSTVYVKQGNLSGANEIYVEALKRHPDSLALTIRAIKTHLDLGKTLAAYHLIQKLNRLGSDEDKKNERYYGMMLLGEFHLRTGDVDSALSSFNKALVVSPSSYEINYYLGLTHLLQNKPRLSKEFLKKAVRNNPGFVQAHLLLAGLYLSSGQYGLASEHAGLALQLAPDNRSAHAINGVALYLQGRLKEAEYEFETLRKLDENNHLSAYFNALTAMNRGHFSEAKQHIKRIDPKFVDRLFLEIEFLKSTGVDLKRASGHLHPFLDQRAGFLSHVVVGQYYMENGAFDLAATHLEKAILSNHDNPAALYLKASIESQRGKTTTAISVLKKIIETNPQFVKSYQALGVLYEQHEAYEEAKKIYEQGLAYYPEDAMLLNNLGWILLNHFQDKTTAYSYIRKAIGVSPEDEQINDTLGWWYYLNGDYEEAIDILSVLVDKKPEAALYRYHLGMSYVKSDKMALALPHLEKALALGISDELEAKILRVLKL